MSSTTHQQREQHQQQPSIWTRSTVYERHEKRRAKTIQNANDDRPALVRVLAQIRPSEPNHNTALTTTVKSLAVSPVVVDTDTTTMFTTHSSSLPITTAAQQKTAHSTTRWRDAALSAALGARLVDASMTLFSMPASPSSVPRTFATTSLEASELSLSLRLPTPAVVSSSTTRTVRRGGGPGGLFLRAPTTNALPRSLLSSPSVAPLVVLFGTQAAVSSVGENTMAASVVASCVAGAALGLVRTGGQMLLHESRAAVVYFGSYQVLHRALGGGGGGGGHIASVAVAGAMAGTLYEAVRGQALFHTTAASPFSPRSAVSVARAAPVHALFFVGYETVHSLLS